MSDERVIPGIAKYGTVESYPSRNADSVEYYVPQKGM